MTEYVKSPPRWQAVKWDGTNIQDVVNAAVVGGSYDVAVSPDGSTVTVLVVAQEMGDGSALYRPLHLGHYVPWLVYRPISGPRTGEYLVAVPDDNGGPAGFDEA